VHNQLIPHDFDHGGSKYPIHNCKRIRHYVLVQLYTLIGRAVIVFLRMMRDVWIETQQQGIAVIGYKPSERDRVMMSKDALAVKRARSSIKRK
jgi:hypothetical protein